MAVSLLEVRRQILLNTPHIESVSGSIATFSTDLSTNLTDMKIHFHPVQEGTGDPSPDNIRPIHGWDGLTVTRCGKNLFDKASAKAGRYINVDGTWVFEENVAWYSTPLIKIKPNTRYSVFGGTPLSSIGTYINAYDENMTRVNYTTYQSYLTTAATAKYISVHGATTSAFYKNRDTVVICEGSEIPTDYEPYTFVEIPISFGRTIYGGYVDLVKGEVVEENYHTILDGVNHYFTNKEALNNGYASSYAYFGSGSLSDVPVGIADGSPTGYTNLICDTFPTARTAWRSECVQTDNWANYVRLCLSSNRLQDVSTTAKIVESINTWLTENPINICYKLRTPIVHSLTPQTIKTLKGINNIWSDANGDVEVRFWVH